jgi:hypothetical protein
MENRAGNITGPTKNPTTPETRRNYGGSLNSLINIDMT